jgi:transcription elongation factor Elf1
MTLVGSGILVGVLGLNYIAVNFEKDMELEGLKNMLLETARRRNMKSWYSHLKEVGELKRIKCNWCGQVHESMYEVDTGHENPELVCETCLKDNEYDEDDVINELNKESRDVKDLLK